MPVTHTRILNLTGALWKTVAINGAVQAEYTVNSFIKRGQSDAAMGPITLDKTFYVVSGWLEVDDDDEADLLCDGSIGVLVLQWDAPLGSAETTTFGVLADTTGVIFLGTSGGVLETDAATGPTVRTRINFRMMFHADDTDLHDTLLSSTDA